MFKKYAIIVILALTAGLATPATAQSSDADVQKAIRTAEAECEKGMAESCYALARVHSRTPRDESRMATYAQRACDLGYDKACLDAAEMLASGIGRPKDSMAALLRFGKLCRSGVAIACESEGAIAADPAFEAANRDISLRILRESCANGSIYACEAGVKLKLKDKDYDSRQVIYVEFGTKFVKLAATTCSEASDTAHCKKFRELTLRLNEVKQVCLNHAELSLCRKLKSAGY